MSHERQIEQKSAVIAVLGTGIIGAPVARNLHKKGFAVRVWNRSAQKAHALSEEGIVIAADPAEAVKGADIVITVLKDGPAIESTISSIRPEIGGAIWIQLSTVGIEATERLKQLAAAKGWIYFDAPVQGTRQSAEAGKLVILASGPTEGRERAQPIFDAIGSRSVWVSELPGDATKLKLALNSLVLALTHGTAESLSLAKALGVDPALVVDVVKGGPLDSPFFQAKASAILNENFEPSFTINNAIKDSKLVDAAAKEAGLKLDLVTAGKSRFERAAAYGAGNLDIAASYLA
ncbi:3-hydroxyisobutyrate dehydrogenase [Microvirga vignae]|uniref:3-hydroxyisobutyrate dehydrogenase n=1 Tax=Microvirga vignae TaxID=1225564 RepID=A0A0H1RA52_9HYPH|nr:NAD(P)-dependent oxidoreductase [Microvirga vignae]KLK91929.1 3-hydroxyisobutyrate dehydrogenase [Microvirga vignae]